MKPKRKLSTTTSNIKRHREELERITGNSNWWQVAYNDVVNRKIKIKNE